MRAVDSYRFGISNTKRMLATTPTTVARNIDRRCAHKTEAFLTQLGPSGAGIVVVRCSVCIVVPISESLYKPATAAVIAIDEAI